MSVSGERHTAALAKANLLPAQRQRPGGNECHSLVTGLSASAIAHQANDHGTTLRETALASGYVSGKDFDRIVSPSAMVGE